MYKQREFSRQEKNASRMMRLQFESLEIAVKASIPESRERSIVLSHLEDAMLHYNVAIAENGLRGE